MVLHVLVSVVAWFGAFTITAALSYGFYRLVRGSLRRWRTLPKRRVALEATGLLFGLVIWLAFSQVVP
jgi:hypothetical protein